MQIRLTENEKKTLLRLAREAIETAVESSHAATLDLDSLPPALRQPMATFVTLYNGDQLRGCIGGLTAEYALAEDVRIHAAAAATKDFRFPPIRADEIPQLKIEISVLSTPEPLDYQDAEDLLGKLQPGVDGVILQQGNRRATFLPQVWKKIPDPEHFLGMLCEKAFLPSNAWKSGKLQVLTYHVLPICETDPQDE